jgi:hypothetical protein
MQTVPLQPTPNQTLQCVLGGQSCALRVYQRRTGLYVDVSLVTGSAPVVAGVIGRDRNRIVRDAYLGFLGDLAFMDAQGTDDPSYDGLGGRFVLLYLAPGEPLP